MRRRISIILDRYILKRLYTYNDPLKGLILCAKSRKGRERENVEVYLLQINGIKVLCFCLDKEYRMGTIGISEGEIITLAFEYATKKRMPLISIVASGGMRVQDGTLALMQMAKMTLAAKLHDERGLLHIAVVTNPTLGGASASFVSLADIIVAEKGAVYGFAGKRIICNTTNEKLPEDFQSASFAKRHGMVDIVVEKDEVESIIILLLKLHRRG